MNGSPGYQPIWVPVENTTDCSQGFCSIYCPQWCYVIFPPPPPFDGEDSGSTLSPLVIAIIGILASAFILVSYYTVVAKYCGSRESARRRSRATATNDQNSEGNQNAIEAWLVPPNSGLDESAIDSIGVCRYKKGNGFIVGSDCSVCLGEFQEDESLRLLPKCSHAFHLHCIDKWLQAHSNCPLCRASVVAADPSPVFLHLPSAPPEISIPVTLVEPETRVHGETREGEEVISSTVGAEEDGVIGSLVRVQEREVGTIGANIDRRSQSDLCREEGAIIEIGDEEIQALRRSISMDSSNMNSISMVIGMSMIQEDGANGIESSSASVGSEQIKGMSKGEFSRNDKNQNRVRVLPPMLRRSSSSERFLLVRGRRAILPL